ncbi:MAG: hypothetical protein QHH15_01525 [Candidatus Thermoplasmatota archaeon]|nr:hypothetical protein [Candidatus Thermoplasmatota archaeon]
MSKKPCCPACAMRNVRQIFIGGILTGIVNLDNILQEVYELGIKDENKLKKELLEKVKIYNYVASGVEKQYEDALFNEYQKYLKNRMD